MGTLINAAGVIVGSAIGLILRKYIKKHTNEALIQVIGFAAAIMGLLGLLSYMLTTENGVLRSQGVLLLFVSLAIGTLVGSSLRLDDRLNAFSDKLQTKLKTDGLMQGFLSATIIYCIGAMTLMSPLREAINGDMSVSLLKTSLDSVTAVFLAASLGIGVMLSACSILIIQGGIYLFAQQIVPYAQGDMLINFSIVGYALVILIGTNMLGATKIKTTDLLPSLIIPIIWTLVGIARY